MLYCCPLAAVDGVEAASSTFFGSTVEAVTITLVVKKLILSVLREKTLCESPKLNIKGFVKSVWALLSGTLNYIRKKYAVHIKIGLLGCR